MAQSQLPCAQACSAKHFNAAINARPQKACKPVWSVCRPAWQVPYAAMSAWLQKPCSLYGQRQRLVSLTACHAGGVDGHVVSFDLTTGDQVSSFQAAADPVNGFSFHPYLPLAATASGLPLPLFCSLLHMA